LIFADAAANACKVQRPPALSNTEGPPKSGSKLTALHTLREVERGGVKLHGFEIRTLLFAKQFDQCLETGLKPRC
jgi:hypothetical protein